MKQEDKMSKTRLVPFDIEKAKNGAKIVTRCGYPVRVGFYDVKNEDYPILCLVEEDNGRERSWGYTKNGKYHKKEDIDSPYDLFIEEEKEKHRREYSGTDSIYVPKDDEGIREELIDAINGLWNNDALPMPLSLKRKDAWLNWLHKQSQKNTADEVEKEVKKRVMTYQEVAWWLRRNPEEFREWKFRDCDGVNTDLGYNESKAHQPAKYILIRKNGGEWKEPLIEEE